MARWKLKSSHYLSVPGTEWEYKETDRTSGRSGRKIFIVPLFLNPDDQADHNYPGEIIVANKPGGRDIVFEGPPTPDMEPLDDEAEALSTAESHKWKHPIESLDGNFSASLLNDLERQVAGLVAQQPAKPVSLSTVSKEEFEELKAQMAALTEKNAELQARRA